MRQTKHDFPFAIMDVASLLGLHIRRPGPDSVYADCPFCGDKRGRLNLNLKYDVFRCNHCDAHGGMLDLYANLHGMSRSEANREIADTLRGGASRPLPTGMPVKKVAPVAIEQSKLASILEIHQTLTALFGLLHLENSHRKKLRERGLSDSQIDALGYKSTPAPKLARDFTARLMEMGCIVQGVPGFYVDAGGHWTFRLSKRIAGFFVPIRGIDGLLRGAQIRLDVPIRDAGAGADEKGTKYLWFSSASKQMGVSSGSPVHYIGDPRARVVYVTEGALKGDVSYCLMNRTFACVAGANNWRQLDPLFALLAYNGTQLIIEAHDMDKYRNCHIDKGASHIFVMARKHGLESRRLTWDPNHKGIDDWQLALKRERERLDGKKVNSMTFKEAFLRGECQFDALEGYVEKWQGGAGEGKTMDEYLGFTPAELATYSWSKSQLEWQLCSQRSSKYFRLYQLEFTPECPTRPYAFKDIKALYAEGNTQPPAEDYRLVHEGEIIFKSGLEESGILARIAARYRLALPPDYLGRCVAASDVIELYDSVESRHYYCNGDDFTEVGFYFELALPMKV